MGKAREPMPEMGKERREVAENQDRVGPQRRVKKRSEEEMMVLKLLVILQRGVLRADLGLAMRRQLAIVGERDSKLIPGQ